MTDNIVAHGTVCQYFQFFENQHPDRPVRACRKKVMHRVFYQKGNQYIFLCTQHATRVRAANSAFVATQREQGI